MSKLPPMPPMWNMIMVHCGILYLPWAVVAWRWGLVVPFIGVIFVLEAVSYLIWRRAVRNKDDFGRHLVGWISVGDPVLAFAAVGLVIASGHTGTPEAVAIFAIWVFIIAVQWVLAGRTTLKPGSQNTSPQSGWPETLRKVLEVWMAGALMCIGLVGCIVAYVMAESDWVPAAVAVLYIGLACVFSAQLRALLIAAKMRGLEK